MKTQENLGYFIKQIENSFQVSVLVIEAFFLGIFLVEMTSFMFLSQHRDTQAIFYCVNQSMAVLLIKFFLFGCSTMIFVFLFQPP